MKMKWLRIMAAALCMVMFMSQAVMADGIFGGSGSYVSLGADLTDKEKETVLNLLNIDNIDDYEVEYITNEQEHEYLDEYLSASVIGHRALSSVFIQEGGSGIEVKTYNIGYCTEGMYRNALATAGMENASVTVAGPFNISGTAALVGAMKAYESMTGEKVSEENLDAANQELVVTGEVAESVGQEEAEQLMALVKEKVIAEDLKQPEEIMQAVDDAAQQLEISLSEEDKQMIRDLMKKIGSLDLNIDQLREQAKEIYNKLEDMGLKFDQSFFDKLKAWVLSIFDFLQS